MSLKLEFVEKALQRRTRMAVLCRQYGISRETGYKWLNRYKKQGFDGLEEQSRRPKTAPLATAEDMVLAVLELRERYPRKGPKKLPLVLERTHGAATPSVATIARILRRFGLVRQKSRFRRLSLVESAPKVVAKECNEVWTVDFKGWWRVRDGHRCEPLTVRDAFSRYILAIKVMGSPSMEGTRRTFEALFKRYGLPKAIQCDNGGPFISTRALGGLTRLSAWWVSLGIHVIRSRLGCPQDNGAHERMHADMKAELQVSPAGTLLAEQRECDKFKQHFNQVRPHEALKGKVPAEVYRPSYKRPRATRRLYPSEWIVRTVASNGQIKVQDNWYTVGKALCGYRVALEPLEGLTHRLWFNDLELARVDLAVPNDVVDAVSAAFLAKRKKAA